MNVADHNFNFQYDLSDLWGKWDYSEWFEDDYIDPTLGLIEMGRFETTLMDL